MLMIELYVWIDSNNSDFISNKINKKYKNKLIRGITKLIRSIIIINDKKV